MTVTNIRLVRHKLLPGMLYVVEHERHELYFAVLRGRRSNGAWGGRSIRAKKAVAEYKTDNQKEDGSANSQVDSAESAAAESETASTAIVVAAILDVAAYPAGRPFHGVCPSLSLRGRKQRVTRKLYSFTKTTGDCSEPATCSKNVLRAAY